MFPLVETTEEFEMLKNIWEQAVKTTTTESFFASHAWFFECWKQWYSSRDAELKIIQIIDGDQHFGFLPLVLEQEPLTRLYRKQLKLLLPPDHSVPVRIPCNWIALREQPALLARLKRTVDRIDWDELCLEGLDAVDARTLSHWYNDESSATETTLIARCPVIDLPETWDECFQQFSANKRKEISRNQRRLQKFGKLTLDVVRDPEGINRRLAESIHLSQRRYDRIGYANGFDDDEFSRFHIAAAVAGATRDQVRLFRLKLDAKVIATLYLFKEGNIYHAYQGGYDETWSRFGPGTLIDALAMRYGIEKDGIEFFDFGYGEHSYKTRFRHRLRAVTRLRVTRTWWLTKLRSAKRMIAAPAEKIRSYSLRQ